jgi:para-aminobenzoate synthetase component 1
MDRALPDPGDFLPLVQALIPPPEPDQAFRRLAALPHCLLLDSALHGASLGRYSFLAADPFDYFEVPPDGSDGLAELERRLKGMQSTTLRALPPFQGGAAGLLSYDLARSLERVPRPKYEEFPLPAIAMGLYDVVLAFDHQTRSAWIISQGFPEMDPQRRRRRARQRLSQALEWLQAPARTPRRSASPKVEAADLAPQFPAGSAEPLTSSFSRADYLHAVQRAVQYIHAGDVFQVNLAQRLLCPARDDAVPLYLQLRKINPAPFAAYFDLGPVQIVSASPERFLQVRGNEIEARPIKGTRPRTARPEADLFAAAELLESVKDRAENVMIVDLLRNDLSRVCTADSVRVTQLCELETYAYVQHLVSAVRGRLAQGQTPVDLLRAAIPGGSITGAPKVRAMQIIAELEPTARGAYCGSLGYLGFDGAMDLSILIRTITVSGGWLQLPVGGGIVAQSEPTQEYQETWDKAAGLLRAMMSVE